MSTAMHKLGDGCAHGGEEGQAGVTKIMRAQIGAINEDSGLVP